MGEWVWRSLLLALRLFIILSVLTLLAAAFAAVYSWWNGADSWAAWTVAFWAVLIAGFLWYWIIW